MELGKAGLRARDKLSALAVKAATKPGRYGDGGGLWLTVAKSGQRTWVFRFMRDGRAREMGFGPVADVSLAEARQRADDARRLLRDGLDPIEARRDQRAAERLRQARTITFREAARRYIEAQAPEWRNAKHAAQWTATLARYAHPVIGNVPIAEIDRDMVLAILKPIWTTKRETASRLRGRIERVLDWAKVNGFRTGDNPAAWRANLDADLPKRRKSATVRHHPAMAYSALPAFMVRLRAMPSVSARALEWTILTAARTGETIGATWSEIDVEAALWLVPGARTKSGKDHEVPLCERAIAILTALPREKGNRHLFIGGRAGAGLSQMAMLELLRGMAPGLTVHGFRSTFRDWIFERTNYAHEIAEKALAHATGDETVAAYRRSTAIEKRRRLMRDWAAFCEAPAGGGKVVGIRRRRA